MWNVGDQVFTELGGRFGTVIGVNDHPQVMLLKVAWRGGEESYHHINTKWVKKV